MEILGQLGINETTLHCFIIFIITFFFLKEYLFTPYFASFEERERRTKGGETLAKDLTAKTAELHQQYETEARDLNAEIKDIFEESRGTASKEVEKLVLAARLAADAAMEEARKRIGSEIKKAKDQLSLEVPGVALAITKKMLD